MDLLPENWAKVIAAAFALIAAALTWISSWKKERAIDEQNRESVRDSVPALMKTMAMASVPMPGMAVNQVNDLIAASEKVIIALDRHAATTDRAIEETRRHSEEVRRAAAAAEKQADEARRLQNELRDVREAYEHRREAFEHRRGEP